MKSQFVQFFSPGLLVAESKTKPIDTWDVDTAVEMSQFIVDRNGVTPYGFRFLTQERPDDQFYWMITEKSGMHYLGGNVRTLEQVKAENDPSNALLISNMEKYGWNQIVTTGGGREWVHPLKEGDVVLSYTPLPASATD